MALIAKKNTENIEKDMSSIMINQMLSNKSVYCNEPFDHWVIDNFLDQDVAESLTNEFIDFNDSKDVVHYKGWIGDKKTCLSLIHI